MTPFLKSLIDRPCFTVRANSSISQVIGKFCQHDIGAVVVTSDENAFEGIISERDIVRQLAESKSIDDLIAFDIMTKDVVTVTPSVSSADLIKIMTEKNLGTFLLHPKGSLLVLSLLVMLSNVCWKNTKLRRSRCACSLTLEPEPSVG